MARPRARALAVLAAAAALPGCYFVRVVVPLDPSGMEYPARCFSEATADQVDRTAARVAGLPAATEAHFEECWKNLTHDPRER
jgi:hypothetical protein